MKKPQSIICLVVIGAWFFTVPGFAAAEETLGWDDCVKEALENNPDLIAAREKVVQSRADKNASISDALPQISSQLSDKKSRTAGSKESTTYAYSVSGQQLLFDGFKTTSNIHAAVKSLDAEEYNYLVTSSNIRLYLKTAFSGLLRAQALISLTEEIAKRRKENLELVQVRYEAGREHKGAVLTAQADLAQAEFEVAQAKRNLILVQQELAKELGRDKKTPIRIEGDFMIEESDTSKPDCEALADTTPLLKELIAKKEVARFNVTAAKAEFFPEVYLSGSFGRSHSNWPPEDDTWTAGLTVSLPVFEGGNRVFQLRKAKSQLVQAQANERSGRDGVIYTLEKTWKDFQDAIETVAVKKRFLEAGLERAEISNAQYSAGLTSFDDWIIIENNLVSAKKAYLDAQENVLTAEAYWLQAKGETLEYVKE
ncbi:MAG: TolC family protein [Candidatus Omnitrophica bacterium]|nr:TolC family protein [Candidatus Omnitrophota bacterium]